MNERHESGFTLIELVVSLAILAMALAVLFSAISNSLERARKARDETVAMSLAQSLLTRTMAEPRPDVGETSGRYSNGFGWRLSVTPYGAIADAKAWKMSAYTIRATVTWPGGTRMLSGLCLVPPEKRP